MCKPKSEGGERCSTHVRKDLSHARKQLVNAISSNNDDDIQLITKQVYSLGLLLDETRGGLQSLTLRIAKEDDTSKRETLQKRYQQALERRRLRAIGKRSENYVKTCYKCKVSKPYSDFATHKSNKDGLQKQCKQCNKEMADAYYLRTPERNLDRRESAIRRRQLVYSVINSYLDSGQCKDCGKQEREVLEFDHVRGIKVSSVTDLARLDKEKLIPENELVRATHHEIAKCDIRCGNCHRIKTFTRQKNNTRIRYLNNKPVPERYKLVYEFINKGCIDCKENNLLVLELDHVYGEKVDDVSSMVRSRTDISKLKEELNKCEVRCVNCHKKVTNRRREKGIVIPKAPNKKIKREKSHEKNCCSCGNPIGRGKAICKTCESNSRYQSTDNVISLYKKLGSFVALGKHFGVSDNAVRKYLSSKGIDPKSLKDRN